MANSETCVLIAGVGGSTPGTELIKSFEMAENDYKIVAADMYKNSVGLFSTPYRYVIPPASSSDYIDSLLKICKTEKVDVLTTGSAVELEIVAKNNKIFEKDINWVRPATGINPGNEKKIIGRKVKKNLNKNELIKFKNLL